MKGLTMLAAVTAIALSAVAYAGTPAVGQDAAALGAPAYAMNEPEVSDISALKGEVVFIEHWGIN